MHATCTLECISEVLPTQHVSTPNARTITYINIRMLKTMSGVTYLNTLLKNLAKRNRKYLNSEKRASVCLILRLQDNRNSSSNNSYNNNNTARKNIDEVDIASLNLYDKNQINSYKQLIFKQIIRHKS